MDRSSCRVLLPCLCCDRAVIIKLGEPPDRRRDMQRQPTPASRAPGAAGEQEEVRRLLNEQDHLEQV